MASADQDSFSGRFLEYVLDRADVQRVWEKFTYHEFVEGMGQGTLPVDRFKDYLVQDYLYLVRFILLASLHDLNVSHSFRFNSPGAMRLHHTKPMLWTRSRQ